MPLIMATCVVVGIVIGSFFANRFSGNRLNVINSGSNRLTNLLRIVDDPGVREPLKFLRAREIVHFQRFGEALEMTKDKLNCKNYYFFNPEFDKQMTAK